MNETLRARLTGTQPAPPPPLGALQRPATVPTGLESRLAALEEVVAAVAGVDLEWDADTGEYREKKKTQMPGPRVPDYPPTV